MGVRIAQGCARCVGDPGGCGHGGRRDTAGGRIVSRDDARVPRSLARVRTFAAFRTDRSRRIAEGNGGREFKEETGLTLARVSHVSPPTASSAGLTDETVAFVFGEASGSISRAHQTEHEDIEVRLVSVADIRKLLGSAHGDIISSRLYPLLLGYVSAGAITLPNKG